MTLQLYANPGTSPTTLESYVSPDWEVEVSDTPATVLSWTRSAIWTRTNWWDADDDLTISWLKFGLSGEAVSLSITPSAELLELLGGSLSAADVHLYPPRSFSVMGGAIEINGVGPNARLMIVVGSYAEGGTRHVLTIHAAAPRSEPTGTVVTYNGSQTSVATDTTLHFTGPAVHEAGAIEMLAGSTVEIDGDVIVVGRFFGQGADNWTIGGHGAISGEWTTWEASVAPGEFDANVDFIMVRGFGPFPGSYGPPAGVRVEGVTIFATPYYAVHMACEVEDVTVLSPWTPNTDALHLSDASTLGPATATNCVMWSGDDCVCVGESFGEHRVSDCLVASSASAVFQLGYSGAVEYDASVSYITNIDVVSVGDFFTEGDARYGHIINGYSDALYTSPRSVTRGYEFRHIRIHSDPGGQIRAQPLDLANNAFAFGASGDQVGNIAGILLEDVTFGSTPLYPFRMIGRDRNNTVTAIDIRRLTIDGRRIGVREAGPLFEIDDTLYNVTIDGASLVA